MNQTQKKSRTLVGIVVSDRMQKTVVVKVDRIKQHPKYERRYRVSKKYKAHDEQGAYHVGDKVRIEETRPVSRDKRWRVLEKIANGSRVGSDASASEGASGTEQA